MEHQNTPVIQSIILSEFNDIQGPVIVFQYPDKYFVFMRILSNSPLKSYLAEY